jgi:uncharacterized metal-binding protein (TIGR02443 family)
MKTARFIAGATCRHCGAVDRIVIEELSEGREQRCVNCGHRETMASQTHDARTHGVDDEANDASTTRIVTVAIESTNRISHST